VSPLWPRFRHASPDPRRRCSVPFPRARTGRTLGSGNIFRCNDRFARVPCSARRRGCSGTSPISSTTPSAAAARRAATGGCNRLMWRTWLSHCAPPSSPISCDRAGPDLRARRPCCLVHRSSSVIVLRRNPRQTAGCSCHTTFAVPGSGRGCSNSGLTRRLTCGPVYLLTADNVGGAGPWRVLRELTSCEAIEVIVPAYLVSRSAGRPRGVMTEVCSFPLKLTPYREPRAAKRPRAHHTDVNHYHPPWVKEFCDRVNSVECQCLPAPRSLWLFVSVAESPQ